MDDFFHLVHRQCKLGLAHCPSTCRKGEVGIEGPAYSEQMTRLASKQGCALGLSGEEL